MCVRVPHKACQRSTKRVRGPAERIRDIRYLGTLWGVGVWGGCESGPGGEGRGDVRGLHLQPSAR